MSKLFLQQRFVWLGVFLFFIIIVSFALEPALFHPERNFSGSDIKLAVYHWRTFAVTELKSGRLPLWNPYINSGQPFLAHPESALFYPPNILYLFLPIHYAMTVLVAFHLIVAGLGMYYLVFYLTRRDRWAGLASGVVYTLSGYFAGKIYAGHVGSIISASLFPLVFLLILKAMREKTFKRIVLASCGLTLLIFAGFPENTVYFCVFVIIFFIVKFLPPFPRSVIPNLFRDLLKNQPLEASEILKRVQDDKYVISHFLILLSVIFFGLLLSSIQLLPSLEYVQQTTRAQGLPYQEATILSNSIEQLPNLFSHSFYAKHIGSQYPFWEYLHYVGLVPLLLVGVGLVRWLSPSASTSIFLSLCYVVLAVEIGGIRGIRRIEGIEMMLLIGYLGIVGFYRFIFRGKRVSHPVVLALSVLALVSFTLGFGDNLPFGIYHTLWQYVPVFSRFRIPSHFLLLMIFSISIVAGYGLASIKKTWLTVCIVAFIVIDLTTFFKPFVLTDTNRTYPIDRRLVDTFKIFDSQYRFYHSYGAYTDWANLMNLFDPNSAISQRIESVKGSDTLILKNYADFASIIDGRPIVPFSSQPIDVVINNVNSQLIDLFSTKYFLMLPNEPDLAKVSPNRFKLLTSNERFRLYENTQAMPKGKLMYRVVTKQTKEDISRYMASADFKPMDEIVTLASQGLALQVCKARPCKQEGAVKVVSRMLDRTLYEVDSPTEAILLTSDIYYPGWKAKMETSHALPVLPVDYALRAVVVPAGKHTVEVYFWPDSVMIGGVISLVTLVGIVGILVLARHKYSTSW